MYLIEAFSKVNTDLKLVIAGGSSDTDEYEKELRMKKIEDRKQNSEFWIQKSEKKRVRIRLRKRKMERKECFDFWWCVYYRSNL